MGNQGFYSCLYLKLYPDTYMHVCVKYFKMTMPYLMFGDPCIFKNTELLLWWWEGLFLLHNKYGLPEQNMAFSDAGKLHCALPSLSGFFFFLIN